MYQQLISRHGNAVSLDALYLHVGKTVHRTCVHGLTVGVIATQEQA
jgi:hypothetical protein